MNYGLQLSASGALTATYRQNVLTNNLANINTIGYKPDIVTTRQRDPVRIEDGVGHLPSNALLEHLGAGAMMAPNRVSFDQGQLQITDNDLDLAIEGEGFFMVMDSSHNDQQRFYFSRDGRMTLDKNKRLVMATSGLPVMSTTSDPIHLENGPVSISADGVIQQNGRQVAQIGLVDFPNRERLVKAGASLFRAPSDAVSNKFMAAGAIRQGRLEEASVNEIDAMMSVAGASRDVGANIGMIQYHDRMMNLAINTLGRIG